MTREHSWILSLPIDKVDDWRQDNDGHCDKETEGSGRGYASTSKEHFEIADQLSIVLVAFHSNLIINLFQYGIYWVTNNSSWSFSPYPKD